VYTPRPPPSNPRYEEELDALRLSKQGTALIKSRLAYLRAAHDGKPDISEWSCFCI
jgi:hypothetical protein